MFLLASKTFTSYPIFDNLIDADRPETPEPIMPTLFFIALNNNLY